MTIDFNKIEEMEMPGMNEGTGMMSVRMHNDENYRIIPTRLHPGGSIGKHTQSSGDDMNYVLSGIGKSICDGTEEDLRPGVMRKNNSYVPSDRQMRHVREVLNLMAAMTKDTRFAEVAAESEKGDEPKTMCEVLDRVENRGEKKGRKEATDLINFLWSNGRGDDAQKASNDESFFNRLLSDFNAGKLTPAK